MTGPFDKNDEFDWDNELAKWEEAFEPEVAKEPPQPTPAAEDTPGPVPVAARPAAPPAVPAAPETPKPPPAAPRAAPPAAPPRLGAPPATSGVPRPAVSATPRKPPVPSPRAFPAAPQASPRPPVAGPIDLSGGLGEEEEPTHVKEVPSLLRATTPTTPPPPAPASRGGLAQLFGREPPSSRQRLATRPAAEEIAAAASDEILEITSLPPTAPTAPPPASDAQLPTHARVEGTEDPQEVTRVAEPLEALRAASVPNLSPSSIPPAGNVLLVPEARRHDPDSITSVVDTRGLSLPRPRSEQPVTLEIGDPPDVEIGAAPAVPDLAAELEGDAAEAPADDVDPMEARALWLEDEANRAEDPATRARLLLAVSEIRALRGEREVALAAAIAARDTSPDVPLAHAQVRGLIPHGDAAALIDATRLAYAHAPTAEVKTHVVLLEAIAHHVTGDDDTMAERWKDAEVHAPGDARVLLGRTALAMARGEAPTPIGSRDEELAPVAEAIHTALRTRGLDAPPPSSLSTDDTLRRARGALSRGDLTSAAQAVTDLRAVPELAAAAGWLGYAIGGASTEARASAVEPLRGRQDRLARRALAARGLELGEIDLVHAALASDDALSTAERLALGTLLGANEVALRELDRLADATPGAPLVAASAALLDRAPREHLAGDASGRRALRLGRALGAGTDDLEDAVRAREEDDVDEARALRLSLALAGARWSDISDTLRAGGEGPADVARQLAAALVAERGGDVERAVAAYEAARQLAPAHLGVLRALATLRGSEFAYPQALTAAAEDSTSTLANALLRVEAVTRDTDADDDARLAALEATQEAAPSLPFAPHLAERIARRRGAEELLLRWVRNRRAAAGDPVEGALDAVREALLVADVDPSLAAERLEEAHRARPEDVGLRELYERLAVEPPVDRAAWREARAEASRGARAKVFLLEASLEHERTSDLAAARAAAAKAANGETTGLAALTFARLELATGEVARASDELLALAKTTSDPVERREAYERLAELDLYGRKDAASALLWHRSILDESPDRLASLRYVENALIGTGDEDLEAVAAGIAKVLDQSPGGECTAHAELAARLRMRTGDWLGTRDLAALARRQPSPSTLALRLYHAHAKARGDATEELDAARALLERSSRPAETASLLVDAASAALRAGSPVEARDLLERSVREDPHDYLAWLELSRICEDLEDSPGAAEALESLARASLVKEHQLAAWYDAAMIWLDVVKNDDRAIAALEQVAAVELTYRDVFVKLSGRYAARGARSELAALLERRSASVTDPKERLTIEIERGRVLGEVGDVDAARAAFSSVLDQEPDHAEALAAFADLCVRVSDWDGAEKAWVRLARLLTTPEEQRDVYGRLGDLYADKIVNLARAEVSYKEVLKRAPDDVATTEKLVQVHRRANDAGQALALQQTLVAKATTPEEKRQRAIELADIHETVSHDNRKAEQTLEAARRDMPTDVGLLRALAEFYMRHRQTPAVHILLDRAAADAKRAFAAGRFAPALFEVMATVHDLRGKKDAARAVSAALAAFESTATDLTGAGPRAGDPRLDDLLASEVVTPALRSLLARTGAALDAAVPLDPRALKPVPLPAEARDVAATLQQYAQGMGLSAIQVYVSPTLGFGCVAGASPAPMLVLGEGLLATENAGARTFLIVRGMKLLLSRTSAIPRAQGRDLPVLVAAWLHALNPSWQPQGQNPAQLAEVARRMQPALPRTPEPDLGLLALEVAGALGSQATMLGPAILNWANRAALLAVGDPCAALDAIAWSHGLKGGAPSAPAERATFIAKTAEARDLLAYSVTDAYAEARTRSGAAR